jgi:enhancer of mRNA-decapping protein 3
LRKNCLTAPCIVTWLASGLRNPKFPIDANNIVDIEIAPEFLSTDEGLPQPSISTPPTAQATTEDGLIPSPLPSTSPARLLTSPSSSSHGARHAVLDPAILSYGKPPTKGSTPFSPKTQVPPISRELIEEAVKESPITVTPTILAEPLFSPSARPSLEVNVGIERTNSLATATLSEPFNDLSHTAPPKVEDGSEGDAAELGTHGGKGEKVQLEHSSNLIPADAPSNARANGRKPRTRHRAAKGVKDGPTQTSTSASQPLNEARAQALPTRPRKSRQPPKIAATPTLLVEADTTVVASPSKMNRHAWNWQENRKSSRRDRQVKDAQNGWATEDATDIQEMGDFDFAGNLSKFDKREVFSRLKADDDTADEERLVSHNRLPPKPGTAGGKNLHWTENVLSSPKPKSNGFGIWNSEAGESENETSDAKVSSGKGSRRDTSRSSLRKPQSRKGSAKAGDISALTSARLVAPPLGVMRHSSFDQIGSPRTGRNNSTSPFTGSVTTSRPSLRILGSNKLCPYLTPLHMLEFEAFAVSELGLTEDIMTENAARGIAETTLTIVRSLEKAQGKPDTTTPNPSILIAAGNHKTGARAIAAGRHLQNHGFRVTVCIMGLDREDNLLDSLRHQASAYRKAGGTILKPNELLETLRAGNLKPTFMVDALLGIHFHFDDLRRDDQAFYFEVVIWVNRASIEILSIDVPSGVDSSSGNLFPSPNPPLHFPLGRTNNTHRRTNHHRRPTTRPLPPVHSLPRRT